MKNQYQELIWIIAFLPLLFPRAATAGGYSKSLGLNPSLARAPRISYAPASLPAANPILSSPTFPRPLAPASSLSDLSRMQTALPQDPASKNWMEAAGALAQVFDRSNSGGTAVPEDGSGGAGGPSGPSGSPDRLPTKAEFMAMVRTLHAHGSLSRTQGWRLAALMQTAYERADEAFLARLALLATKEEVPNDSAEYGNDRWGRTQIQSLAERMLRGLELKYGLYRDELDKLEIAYAARHAIETIRRHLWTAISDEGRRLMLEQLLAAASRYPLP